MVEPPPVLPKQDVDDVVPVKAFSITYLPSQGVHKP